MIEIYGVPADIFRCPGCISALNWVNHYKLEYKFHPILRRADTKLGFEYNRQTIEMMRIRAGKARAPTRYPQIFIDGKYIGGFKSLQEATSDRTGRTKGDI